VLFHIAALTRQDPLSWTHTMALFNGHASLKDALKQKLIILDAGDQAFAGSAAIDALVTDLSGRDGAVTGDLTISLEFKSPPAPPPSHKVFNPEDPYLQHYRASGMGEGQGMTDMEMDIIREMMEANAISDELKGPSGTTNTRTEQPATDAKEMNSSNPSPTTISGVSTLSVPSLPDPSEITSETFKVTLKIVTAPTVPYVVIKGHLGALRPPFALPIAERLIHFLKTCGGKALAEKIVIIGGILNTKTLKSGIVYSEDKPILSTVPVRNEYLGALLQILSFEFSNQSQEEQERQPHSNLLLTPILKLSQPLHKRNVLGTSKAATLLLGSLSAFFDEKIKILTKVQLDVETLKTYQREYFSKLKKHQGKAYRKLHIDPEAFNDVKKQIYI